MILLLDHDDSFVHTLAGYVSLHGREARVHRASELSVSSITSMAPTHIILSPGPGTPEACTLAIEVVRRFGPHLPILGVCLGHQVIAIAYGAVVARAAHPRHGRTSTISHDGAGIFTGLPSPLNATRYHSLSVIAESVPADMTITATADDGEVMGVRHCKFAVEGVQFHPESILTEHGMAMIANFLSW